jgi:hypothetical protein
MVLKRLETRVSLTSSVNATENNPSQLNAVNSTYYTLISNYNKHNKHIIFFINGIKTKIIIIIINYLTNVSESWLHQIGLIQHEYML